MKVPYNYLPFEFNNKSTKSIFNEWKKLIKTSDFTLGSFVKQFEEKFAKYIGGKYCIATNNGTDALILSLKAAGISKDDEVITVTNSFYATTGAIVAVGAKPIFVDCDERYQINVEEIKRVFTKKTKAILPVHWGGASPNMEAINKIAKRRGLIVIEDACMGIGAKIHGKSPGTFGLVGAYSMHPLKSLNVMGDGGMVVTNNQSIYKWMLKYRNHGMVDRDNIDFWGVNYRIQPLQAIVAMDCLKRLDKVIKIRNKNAKFYDSHLKNLKPFIEIPKRPKGYMETYALYMVLCKKRDQLQEFLKKNKIECKIHYPIPLHLQKASKQYGYRKGMFPIAEDQAKKLLTIPVHQFLNQRQLNYVINCIKKFYN